jgi:hypothetical protein
MANQTTLNRQGPGLFKLILYGRDGAGFGLRLSVYLSAAAAWLIWLFFIRMRGWDPPASMEAEFLAYVHWGLLLYLGTQLTIQITTSAGGGRAAVWLDTATSLVPLVLILYVLTQHWNHYTVLPLDQLRIAKSTALTLGIDFIVDFGLATSTQKRAGFFIVEGKNPT